MCAWTSHLRLDETRVRRLRGAATGAAAGGSTSLEAVTITVCRRHVEEVEVDAIIVNATVSEEQVGYRRRECRIVLLVDFADRVHAAYGARRI
jgi:hypothetical protein